MNEDNSTTANGNDAQQEEHSTALVGIPVMKEDMIDKIIGSEPVDWYAHNVFLIRERAQLLILDHSKQYVEGILIQGEPLNRASLPEGAVVQGLELVVGTTGGDHVFEGVNISICVVQEGSAQIPVVSTHVHPNAETVARLKHEENNKSGEHE